MSVELSIVMPVYNEAGVLRSSLDEALGAIRDVPYRCEILLVDDASRDESPEILAEYAKRYPQLVRVLRHEKNRGIMGSLDTLFRNAAGEFVFFNSSDGQFKTEDCVRMMELRDRYDIIVGRRIVKLYNLRRHVVSWAFNVLPRVLCGVRTYDAGSIKLYRKEVLSIPLVSRGPFREAERIIRASLRGYRIGQVAVVHHQRRAGRASGADWKLLGESVLDLFRCWRLFGFFRPLLRGRAG